MRKLSYHNEIPNYNNRKYRSIVLDGLKDADYKYVEKTLKEYRLADDDPNIPNIIYKALYEIAESRDNLKGLTYEEIKQQRQLSSDMNYWVKMGEDNYWFKSEVAEDWRFTNPILESPVSNLDKNGATIQYLRFKNIEPFIRTSLYFEEQKVYTKFKDKQKQYTEFWATEWKKCLYGISEGGVRITGRYYFYLNYGRLKASQVDRITGVLKGYNKKFQFPRFFDHQYYLSLEVENMFGEVPYLYNEEEYYKFTNNKIEYNELPSKENEFDVKGLQNLLAIVITKARRLGLTYFFSDAILMYNYTFSHESNNVLLAENVSKYVNALRAVTATRNHLNANTEFKQARQVLDQSEHFRGSVLINNDYEAGSMAEIRFQATQGDHQKVVGDSADVVVYEEGGANKKLEEVVSATQPLTLEGSRRSGAELMIGTGGDMTGGTVTLYKIFYNPMSKRFKAYDNIYDGKGKCGLFFDAMWANVGRFMEYEDKYPQGFDKKYAYEKVDNIGNSWRSLAEIHVNYVRSFASDIDGNANDVSQYPKTPMEAFMRNIRSGYNRAELLKQYEAVSLMMNTGEFKFDVGRFEFNPINKKLEFTYKDSNTFINEYPLGKINDKKGSVGIFAHPDKNRNKQFIRYLMAIDSYDQEKTATSESVGSVIVYDRLTRRIVAEYHSREDLDDFHSQCLRLAIYYDAKVGYDSNTPGIDKYFVDNGYRHLLVTEPTLIRSVISTGTKQVRDYGVPMSAPVQKYAKKLLKQWLNSPDDFVPDSKYLNSIMSIGTILELMDYNEEQGNYDRHAALMILMVMEEEYRMMDVIDITMDNKNAEYVENNRSFYDTLKQLDKQYDYKD